MTIFLIILALLAIAGQIVCIIWSENPGLGYPTRTVFWVSTAIGLAAGLGLMIEGLSALAVA